jgi:predicted chitinase
MNEDGSNAYFTRKYENNRNLGNNQRGDGVKFHGRGPMQLTGRWNYGACSKSLSGNQNTLLNNPGLVATDPRYSWGCSGWFWNFRKLNALADRGAIAQIGVRVNGGGNGASERVKYYNRAKRCLGI